MAWRRRCRRWRRGEWNHYRRLYVFWISIPKETGGEHGTWLAVVAHRDSHPHHPDCLAPGRPARLKDFSASCQRDMTPRRHTGFGWLMTVPPTPWRAFFFWTYTLLAIVAAVIMQTLRARATPGAFAAGMEGRIAASERAMS